MRGIQPTWGLIALVSELVVGIVFELATGHRLIVINHILICELAIGELPIIVGHVVVAVVDGRGRLELVGGSVATGVLGLLASLFSLLSALLGLLGLLGLLRLFGLLVGLPLGLHGLLVLRADEFGFA